jgi:hypothetical protein
MRNYQAQLAKAKAILARRRVEPPIEGDEVRAEVARAAQLEGINYPYPPGVDKDQYDAQTILEGGGAEADAAAARIDAREDAAKDLTDLFFIRGEGSNFFVVCNYRTCKWDYPMLGGTMVSEVFQQMTSHAYTNHGRPMV